MQKEELKYIKVKDLKLNPKNPRQNDKAVDAVAKSIERFGFRNPLLIDKDNIVWCGNTRLKASIKLGLEEVPCLDISDLSKKEIRALALADNKTNEIADWDEELLQEELNDLIDDFDMSEFGFESDLEELLDEKEVEEDNFNVDENIPEVPKAKLGDIYQLGEHRLMCGDSTSITDIEKLMNGVKADMIFTDPPYGMKKEKDGVANDNLNYDDLLEFNKQWIPLTFDALKDNGSWYCWGIDEPLMDIYSEILKPMKKANEITIRNYLTWAKECGQGQCRAELRSYATASEKCWFIMKGVQGFNTNSDNYYEGWEPLRTYLSYNMQKVCELKGVPNTSNSWDKLLKNKMGSHYFTKSQWVLPTKEQYSKMQELGREYDLFKREYDEIKREYDEIKREYYKTRAYFDNTHDNMNDVWHFNRTSGQERETAGGHATPKPIALCSRAIKSSSRENEFVLDVFGGSGSTLIACEQLNRKAMIMELEPKWCDVIIKRWEDFTGKKAILIEGEK